jgi:hypothetical protein
MSTIIPKIRTRFGENIGVEIFVQPPDLGENKFSFLNTDQLAGVSSFPVDNALMFNASEYIAILPGGVGALRSEILQINSPTASSISLLSASLFPHNRGDKIVFIPYNQIIIEKSVDGITYSSLTTLNIRLDSMETYYADVTGLSTYYYRARFSNSATANVSQNSDGIIATGYIDGSAGQIIRAALISLGEKVDGEVLTKEFLFQALHEGRQEMDTGVNVDRWSFRTKFDQDIGDIIAGRNTVAVPTDLREPGTNKNILSIRLGRNNKDLVPVTRRRMNQLYLGIAHSTLTNQITSASTSIVLGSSGDFDESGAITVAAEDVSGVLDTPSYTTNTESTKTLSGVTAVVSTHAAGRDVWQRASFGMPLYFTVDSSLVTFSQPFANDFAGENIKMDYYAKLTRADSENDMLDEPWAEPVYIPYMKWRIQKKKDSSVTQQNPNFLEYDKKAKAVAAKEWSGQDLIIVYN